MNSVDIIFGVLLAFFIIIGLWRGFFREVLGLLGIIGGIFLAIIGFGPLGKILSQYVPGIPAFIWPFLSFIVIFIAVYILSRILAGVLSRISESIFLGWLNHLLGGVVGGLKGAILISLFLLLIGFFPFQSSLENVRQGSLFYDPLQRFLPATYSFVTGFNTSSYRFEEKLVNSLQDARVKLNEQILKYLFYGKQDTSSKQ